MLDLRGQATCASRAGRRGLRGRRRQWWLWLWLWLWWTDGGWCRCCQSCGLLGRVGPATHARPCASWHLMCNRACIHSANTRACKHPAVEPRAALRGVFPCLCHLVGFPLRPNSAARLPTHPTATPFAHYIHLRSAARTPAINPASRPVPFHPNSIAHPRRRIVGLSTRWEPPSHHHHHNHQHGGLGHL